MYHAIIFNPETKETHTASSNKTKEDFEKIIQKVFPKFHYSITYKEL